MGARQERIHRPDRNINYPDQTRLLFTGEGVKIVPYPSPTLVAGLPGFVDEPGGFVLDPPREVVQRDPTVPGIKNYLFDKGQF